MPTYTYKCNECDVCIEKVHGMSEDLHVLCGTCGNAMNKIITGCGFILKGGGWGKDLTEKKERESRSEKLKEKTREKTFYKDEQSAGGAYRKKIQ